MKKYEIGVSLLKYQKNPTEIFVISVNYGNGEMEACALFKIKYGDNGYITYIKEVKNN